jgi:hypothetical protein
MWMMWGLVLTCLLNFCFVICKSLPRMTNTLTVYHKHTDNILRSCDHASRQSSS